MAAEDQPNAGLADLIASDTYWIGPVVDPMAGLSRRERRAYKASVESAIADETMVDGIGNVAMSLAGGGSLEGLSEGDEFPELENARQVVRIVEDSRTVLSRHSSRYRRLRSIQRALAERAAQGEIGDFDATAAMLLDPNVLYSLPAVDIKVTRPLRAIGIERHVSYMAPMEGNELGVCINSLFIRSRQDLEDAVPLAVPLVPVGSVYHNWTGGLSKVVRADIIEAEGVIWQDGAPRKPTGKKPATQGLIPRLVPGMHS